MRRNFLIFSFLAIAAAAPSAFGDALFLLNGDHLTGALQEVRDGYVVFTTEYAGVLQIPQTDVERIEWDLPVIVLMQNGAELDGVLEFRRGENGVRNEAGWQAAPLAEVSAVRVQETAEAPAPEEETKKKRQWSGSVDTGLDLRRGNTDTTDFSMGTTVVGETEWDTLTLKGSGAYGEAENVLNTRQYQGEVKWQVYPKDRLYLYGLLGAEHDDGRKLDLRAQGGGGLGYDFVRNEKRTFSGDLGVTYTYERWNPYTPQERDQVKADQRKTATANLSQGIADLGAGNTLQALGTIPEAVRTLADPLRGAEKRTDEFANVRASAQYEQSLFQRSKISENVTLQPNLEDLGEYRLTSDLAFTTPISKELGLRMNLISEYDSQADERGIDAWDNRLQTGLHYEFGAPRKTE